MKTLLVITTYCLLFSCATPNNQLAQITIAQAVNTTQVGNFYRISKDLYRSKQPHSEGFKYIQKLGVKTVLNLRSFHTDNDEARGTHLNLQRYPMSAGSITQEQLMDALVIIAQSPKPVLLHCKHGADRTGAIAATYRIVEQGWNPQKAVEEMRWGPYGFHNQFFSYLDPMLKNIDWEQFKTHYQQRLQRDQTTIKASKSSAPI